MCLGNLNIQLNFKIRYTQLENTLQCSNVSETTYNTAMLNKSFSFKVEVLCEESLQWRLPQFDAIVRSDCNSYYSKWKRFLAIMGIKRGVPNRFTFEYTCLTGNRTTPCVNNINFLRQSWFILKHSTRDEKLTNAWAFSICVNKREKKRNF